MAKYLLEGPGLRARVVDVSSASSGYWRDESGKTFHARWEGTMSDILVDQGCSTATFDTAAAEAQADGGTIKVTLYQWNAALETKLWSELLMVVQRDWTELARSLGFVRGGADPERTSIDQERRKVEFVFPTNLGRIIGENGWRIKKYASVARSCGWELRVNDGGRRDSAQARFDGSRAKAERLLVKWEEEVNLIRSEFPVKELEVSVLVRALETFSFDKVVDLMSQTSGSLLNNQPRGMSAVYSALQDKNRNRVSCPKLDRGG